MFNLVGNSLSSERVFAVGKEGKQQMKIFVKSIVAVILVLVFNTVASACPRCRAEIKGGTYDQNFFYNLFVLLLPVIILTAIGFGLYHADKISDKLKGRIKRWLIRRAAH